MLRLLHSFQGEPGVWSLAGGKRMGLMSRMGLIGLTKFSDVSSEPKPDPYEPYDPSVPRAFTRLSLLG